MLNFPVLMSMSCTLLGLRFFERLTFWSRWLFSAKLVELRSYSGVVVLIRIFVCGSWLFLVAFLGLPRTMIDAFEWKRLETFPKEVFPMLRLKRESSTRRSFELYFVFIGDVGDDAFNDSKELLPGEHCV